MSEQEMLQEFLDGGQVDPAVFALRPDYRALLLAVDGLVPGPGDQASEGLLQAAESAARELLNRYSGAPRLVRAAGGAAVIEHPEPGEVVWRDDAGVTCRRWNWRQAHRTQLGEDTTDALFILDALEPMTDEALQAAAEDLAARLTLLGPDVRVARRLIAAGTPANEGH
jgi:hypothetical protein